MLFMFSHTRSLVAAGLALLAVICAGLWLRNRTIALNELTETTRNLQAQISAGRSDPVLIANYARRLETLRADIEKITSRFAGRDYEAHMLVRDVVKAASRSGMEMTNTSRHGKKAMVLSAQDKGVVIDSLSHAITLKGPYVSMVKFLQNLAAWNIGHKIESIEVTAAADGGAEDKIEVALVLSVFLLE
ncbi:MAG: hypothetical protein PHP98_08085 [Kiritimatiellae bacterium]|nr:hypothetical protein [Kiritimatiellia bacterium]